jgi:hypothetical protein
MRRSVIPLLPLLSAEAVVVLVYLVDRTYTQQGIGVGLSITELARACGLAAAKIPRILKELEDHTLITQTEKPKYVSLTLTNQVCDGVEIPFTFKNTDDTKLVVAEAEIRRLRLQSERERAKQSSGLAEIAEGEERDLYLEIERRGFGITPNEANLLGKSIAQFGVPRTRDTYRQVRKQKNPILATYAALRKGIRGQGAKQLDSEPFTKIHYKDL